MTIKYFPILFAVSILAILSVFSCRTLEFESALLYIEHEQDWDKAVELLHKSLEKRPADIEAHLLLGQCYGMKQDYPKMKAALDSAEFYMAILNNNLHQYQEAIEYLKDEFWCYSFNQGVTNFENNQFDEAGIDFNNCIIIDEKRAEAYINLGLVAECVNNVDSAIVHYQTAFVLDKENLDLMFYVAELFNNQNQFEKTIQTMDSVLSVFPDHIDAIIQQAIAFDYLGDITRAIKLYQKALSMNPDDSDLIFNLGRLYFQQGDYLEAIKQLEKVAKNNVDDDEAIVLLGECYFSLGQDIIIYLQENVELDSTTLSVEEIDAFKIQATAYFKTAIHYLKQAVNKNAGNPDVLNLLAMAYANIGFTDKAEAIFQNETPTSTPNKK